MPTPTALFAPLRNCLARAAVLTFFVPASSLIHPALGQNHTFTTLAGAPGGYGSNDGRGRDARFRHPTGVAVDRNGNIFVTDTGNNTIRKITADGVVSTLAGSGISGSADGASREARFNSPTGLAVDFAGNVFVADSGNHIIRKISADGNVTTLAGTAGSEGNADGRRGLARFFVPTGIAVDRAGNVFVADVMNSTVRRITADGVVTTLAGLANNRGQVDGIGSAARFGYMTDLAIDASGNLYVGQTYAEVGTIRRISPTGVVTTLANLSVNYARGLAVDGNGGLLVATDNRTICRVGFDGVLTTIAGTAGQSGSRDGRAEDAKFNFPRGVAADAHGNIFVADSSNHNIRKIAAGVVTTFAGGAGSGSNDGLGDAARFDGPNCVAVDARSNLFVTDGNNLIRKIAAADGFTSTLVNLAQPGIWSFARGLAADAQGNVFVAETYSDGWDDIGSVIRGITAGGTVSTVAGSTDRTGSMDGTSSVALFRSAAGMAVDARGDIFVADSYNHAIRRITAQGVVTTVAGHADLSGSVDDIGRAARFKVPTGLAADSLGHIFVADTGNHTIRKITPEGVVTTLAGSVGQVGSADGAGSAARFNYPLSVAVDPQGNVFVADTSNHTIRKITPAGIVTTVAGHAGSPGSADGAAGVVQFNSPTSVAVDKWGNVFVADSGNNTIRLGVSGPPVIATQPLSQTVSRGRTAMFSVTASPAALYQWTKDGIVLAGATHATLILAGVDAAHAGTYRCAVTHAGGSMTSAPATLTVAETNGGRSIANFSFRAALSAGRTVSAGFVLDTSGQKTVLVRGIGPTLRLFGVNYALADPKLEIFSGAGQRLDENDNWPAGLAAIFASTGAFALPAGSRDAALLLALPPGAYTAVLSGVGGASGEALVEIYEVP